MGKLSEFGQHLYNGTVSFEFVARRKLWYTMSALIVVLAATGLLVRGVNYGIEFEGGVEFTAQIAPTQENVDKLTQAVIDAGVPEAGDPIASTSGQDAIRIQTIALEQAQATQIEQALTAAGATDISQNLIGPTWGQQVANKALLGLIVFLIVVIFFIWAYFREWRMSFAAIIALAHDLVITVGVYAWSGFEVTPATVTGFLTILGYSLYDTVVVFDKVRENTRNFDKQTRRTFPELSNLAVNQTLVRSINTSVTALLPVGALLIVGTVVLGTGPLKDLALALFVGMAAGTYSSIFIATPLASQLKEHESSTKAHTKRVLSKRGRAVPKVSDGVVSDGTETDEEGVPAEPVPARPTASTSSAPSRPVGLSGSSGRNQPQRGTRSQRGKGKR